MISVKKFGGSSVADANAIKSVFNLIKSELNNFDKVIVVVSAQGGITDLLLKAAEIASSGKTDYQPYFQQISDRLLDVIDQLFDSPYKEEVLLKVQTELQLLNEILKALYQLKELTLKSKDYILSFGEIISSVIIHSYFNSNDIKSHLADPKAFIQTDSSFTKATVYLNETFESTKNYFEQFKGLVICPGFIGSNKKGETTTLGRGGSDFTASLIASALEIDYLEIWTDVSGMLTADPRFVQHAHPISVISYEDAMELSHFGAKVIYPPTIQPAREKKIPIHIKNTFAPDEPGTVISFEDSSLDEKIKGLSCVQDIALLNFKGSGMVGIPNFSNRLFKSVAEVGVNVILITQASSEHSICLGINEKDVAKTTKSIKKEFAFELQLRKIDPIEVEKDLSIIALVGQNMRKQIGVAGKMFETLGSNGINIKAIAQGSSERNISVVIDTINIKKALSSLHESFFLSGTKRINLFVLGVGNVGGTFLNQINNQKDYLSINHHIDLKVIGIANSKKMYFNEDGINLSDWSSFLSNSKKSFSKEAFYNKVKSMNLRNSIFIDNTASKEISDMYGDFLRNTISVVTPNKVACSSSYSNYKQLKNISLKNKSKFYYETNVGAGLPIITTINDLVKTGDTVLEMHAVLSGSLNFI
ncbi:MAG: bifunctional aspartate kinase/homoserine dehydrogenase I, partial [Cyclobacteriaceae bacterium]|nr:bifunctional aspartate kinase/homoserine dehydrogenase I [Cyclobacteriaceae bacterium]